MRLIRLMFRRFDGFGAQLTQTSEHPVGAWSQVEIPHDFYSMSTDGAVVSVCIEDDTRTLAAILADVVQHGKDNPTHGTNCACLDKYIREVRAQIAGQVPSSESEPNWERRIDARSRIKYVLNVAARYL